MEERRTSVFENVLIWFGVAFLRAEYHSACRLDRYYDL